jgi:hypothetical protein
LFSIEKLVVQIKQAARSLRSGNELILFKGD